MKIRYFVSRYSFSMVPLLRRPDKIWILLIVASVMLTGISSCKQKKTVTQTPGTFYTCSMHPQIMEPHPGNCPICGMALIAVQKNDSSKTDEIKLSDQQIQLGNIKVDTIGKGVIGNETVLNATLNFDQQKLVSISSRVMGRVDRLYYKSIGDYIKKGAPLLEVYSEALNNAKQEYLLAVERRNLLDNSLINFDQVIQSAKTKLLLWGMSESQVNAL